MPHILQKEASINKSDVLVCSVTNLLNYDAPQSLKVKLLMHCKSIANFAFQMFTERFREVTVAKAKAKVASE